MKTIFVSVTAALVFGGAGLAVAQTELGPSKQDLPEAQKIYSPYVERTATDRNFAEGLHFTHLVHTLS